MLPAGSAPPAGDERRDVLLDFGETIDTLGGAYKTAEDVGTAEPDMQVIAEVTPHVSGLAPERGGSGDPSPWTAVGVEATIRVACERVFGSTSLEGRRIAVVGLGSVGGVLARLLAEGGAELVVADIDERRRALASRSRTRTLYSQVLCRGRRTPGWPGGDLRRQSTSAIVSAYVLLKPQGSGVLGDDAARRATV
jgi:leucine dehydrogenase